MSDLLNPSSIATAFGILLSGGGLAWWIRSGTTVTIAKIDATEARRKADEIAARTAVMESRLNQMDTILAEIRGRLGKLDRVDELVASAKFIEDAIRQMVPRVEQDGKWANYEQRFTRLEADLRESIKVHSSVPPEL
jgi:GTP cyclohydrolase FolE2